MLAISLSSSGLIRAQPAQPAHDSTNETKGGLRKWNLRVVINCSQSLATLREWRQKDSTEWSKKTAIVKLLGHAIHTLGKGSNTSLMSANFSKVRFRLCLNMPWSSIIDYAYIMRLTCVRSTLHMHTHVVVHMSWVLWLPWTIVPQIWKFLVKIFSWFTFPGAEEGEEKECVAHTVWACT